MRGRSLRPCGLESDPVSNSFEPINETPSYVKANTCSPDERLAVSQKYRSTYLVCHFVSRINLFRLIAVSPKQ
jgi:hypothetical protein